MATKDARRMSGRPPASEAQRARVTADPAEALSLITACERRNTQVLVEMCGSAVRCAISAIVRARTESRAPLAGCRCVVLSSRGERSGGLRANRRHPVRLFPHLMARRRRAPARLGVRGRPVQRRLPLDRLGRRADAFRRLALLHLGQPQRYGDSGRGEVARRRAGRWTLGGPVESCRGRTRAGRQGADAHRRARRARCGDVAHRRRGRRRLGDRRLGAVLVACRPVAQGRTPLADAPRPGPPRVRQPERRVVGRHALGRVRTARRVERLSVRLAGTRVGHRRGSGRTHLDDGRGGGVPATRLEDTPASPAGGGRTPARVRPAGRAVGRHVWRWSLARAARRRRLLDSARGAAYRALERLGALHHGGS